MSPARTFIPPPAVDQFFVGLEIRSIRDGELARQPSPAAYVLVALEVDVAAAHSDDARAQDGNELRRRVVAVLAIDERGQAVTLRGLNVHQEHVRRILAHLQGEIAQQIRLERAHAEDEEGAQPDGEQDDARLVPGTGNADTAWRSANERA